MKKILIICPFDGIYPPVLGGTKRYFHIIHQLSLYFDVSILVNQNKADFLASANDGYPSLASVKVFSTEETKPYNDIFNILPIRIRSSLRYRFLQKNPFSKADGNFLQYYTLLKMLLKNTQFDLVILESLSTLNSVKLIRKLSPKTKIVYDAHNVDSKLAAFGKSWGVSEKELSSLRKTESSLGKKVDAVFACSDIDRDELKKMNSGNLCCSTIPNGVVIPLIPANDAVKNTRVSYLIFCAYLSALPNPEGLLWFCKNVWPMILSHFPELKLLVVGGGKIPSEYEEIYKYPQLEFTGRVNDTREWYQRASIAIVPLLSGSGTRLKVLEAMGLGVPVLSTTVGAEGIQYENGKNIIIADLPNDYANALIQLIRDVELRNSIAGNAFMLAKEKYDWNVIGKSLEYFMNSIAEKK